MNVYAHDELTESSIKGWDCESCGSPADGNHEWHGHTICGNCFAEVPAGELAERILG